MKIISVNQLSKAFRRPVKKPGFWGQLGSLFSREYCVHQALDAISFEIGEGELVGYIGPNGAGKSTTIKILSGILVPDQGEVSVLGKVPWKERIATVRELGVVFGQRTQLLWDLPVIESFILFRDMYRIPEALFQKNLAHYTEALEPQELYHVPVRQLSLGQRMRCDLAGSLLHSPRILFLDEPTIGLDAVSKLAVRDFIRHLNQEQRVTIFLTTHDMDDIEALCKRVLILNEGKIFLDGTLQELRKKMAPEKWLIVDLEKEHDHIQDAEATLIKQEGHRVYLSYNPQKTPTTTLIRRITDKHAISDLTLENPPIEEIIAKLYRKKAL